jgi:hypothetical protein
MSGDGVISVRMPASLVGALKATATTQGISVHEAAARILSRVSSITIDDLLALSEPPHEGTNPRASMYVGWRCVDALNLASKKSKLCNSTVIRRVLYGFLVQRSLEFVQDNGSWKLQTVFTILQKEF